MLVGWGILSPLSKYAGWAPGPVGDMTTGARGWILWTSLAIMCTDSLVSLAPVIGEVVSKRLLKGHLPDDQDKDDKEVETEDRLVPMQWVTWGLVGSVIFGTVVVWLVFGQEGIKPWATLIGFGMGGLLSVLGYVLSFCSCRDITYVRLLYNRVRALGETDLNPVSGLGKISQLLFAWIQPGNVVANIIAGGVAEAGAQQYVPSSPPSSSSSFSILIDIISRISPTSP